MKRPKRRKLTAFKLNEISMVDKPAHEGALMTLMKCSKGADRREWEASVARILGHTIEIQAMVAKHGNATADEHMAEAVAATAEHTLDNDTLREAQAHINKAMKAIGEEVTPEEEAEAERRLETDEKGDLANPLTPEEIEEGMAEFDANMPDSSNVAIVRANAEGEEDEVETEEGDEMDEEQVKKIGFAMGKAVAKAALERKGDMSKASDFSKHVDAAGSARGSKTARQDALRKARLENPDDFKAYQATGDAAGVNIEAIRKAQAKQRAAGEDFNKRVAQILSTEKCTRQQAMRKARLENADAFAKLQSA